jgi:hypothetical protein
MFPTFQTALQFSGVTLAVGFSVARTVFYRVSEIAGPYFPALSAFLALALVLSVLYYSQKALLSLSKILLRSALHFVGWAVVGYTLKEFFESALFLSFKAQALESWWVFYNAFDTRLALAADNGNKPW